MGFYGNIKNTSRTQFSFDKIYPSRAEMDMQANLDGIYAGRFILVEYDEKVNMDTFPIGFLRDGIIYVGLPNTTGAIVQPFRLSPLDEEGKYLPKASNHLNPGQLVHVPAEYNFDNNFFDELGVPVDEPCSVFFQATGTEVSIENIPYYEFDATTGKLVDAVDVEGNPMIYDTLTYLQMVKFTSGESNYLKNFNIDRSTYGVSRGYDSTVWQKVYEGAAAKYVMVAELNSVVPTFDITSDAPTIVPTQPHFDTDSTNVYYKLHWQPQWGLRVKGINPIDATLPLKTPCLQPNGESQLSTYINSSIDEKEYPSDVFTSWKNQVYNLNNGAVSEKVFITNDGNGNTAWILEDPEFADVTKIPAAIYFNKAGFSPSEIVYSADKEYKGWENFLVTDEINIRPTGQSGHQYSSHNPKEPRGIAPDTQELSIMLPSIGDSMAAIWDLIYGGRQLDAAAKVRNMDVSWYNARAYVDKQGVRMVNSAGPGQYTYNKDAAGTVAGVMNSVQDLMGMIITDEMPNDPAAANGDYIYYDKENKKYLFKHKNFDFEEKTFENNRIPDDYEEFESVTLDDWDKAYFYVDTGTKVGHEFIMEDKFYKDRKYVPKEDVEASMQRIDLSSEYKPDGSFYLLKSDKYPNSDGSSGATYNYFVGSYEAHQNGTNYYELTLSENQVGEGEAIYTPNTYYYIQYLKVGLTNVTYEPNVYYYIDFTDNMVDKDGNPIAVHHYKLATAENMEDNIDFYGYSVSEYFKRTYTLDTSLKKGNWVYYTVMPQAGQSSNAYYQQKKTAIPTGALEYENYTPKMYYYISETMPDENGVAEIINNIIYVRDDNDYDIDTYPGENREYYTIEIEYILVEGKDIIEINDENAVQVNNMRDMLEFKSGDFAGGHGKDLFYVWVDDAGEQRYIEVNYNNFTKAYNPATQKYEFVVMDYKLIGDPYRRNDFYYKVTDEDNPKAGSFMIDTHDDITPGRVYYKFTPAIGYDYSGQYLTNYYAEGEYYIESPAGSGNFIIATEENKTENQTYFDPTLKLYVMEDPNGIYEKGALWPMTVKQIPEGVILGTRKDVWELDELPGFADKISTLHGLLLRLHNYLNEKDDLTRDTTTARGTVNLFNDLIQRFSALVPGQFVIVDDYGRMHSAQHSTAQALSFATITDAEVSTLAEDVAEGENALITVSINSDFNTPTLSITHSVANVIPDTVSTDNMNTNKDDVLVLETPLIDNAGHVVGRNRHSVTMPYGFKFITPANSDADGDLTINTNQIAADNTQDNFTIAAQNKWIKLATQDNTVQIAHAIINTTFGEQKSNSQDATPKFGDTFNIPVITVDNAGHVTAFTTETVRIPGLTYQEDSTANNDIVLDISYNYNTTTDTGEFVETRGKVDMLTIQDYNITGVASAKLANTDTIHGAFAKLQAQINAMDLAKVGGGVGEYLTDITVEDGIVTVHKDTLPSVEDSARTGEFVSSVSETHGKIAVSRVALEPSITIGAGTADTAPTVNVTVNTKTGTEQALTIATTGVYGVTKLTSDYNHENNSLAMTGVAINKAFETLSIAGEETIAASKTIKSWKETNGIIEITTQDIVITNDNISDEAAIDMAKISGLTDALTAITGDENSAETSTTLNGLSKRIETIVGTEEDDEKLATINALMKRIAALEALVAELHSLGEDDNESGSGDNTGGAGGNTSGEDNGTDGEDGNDSGAGDDTTS